MRDLFSGEQMAKAMSYIMAVFILVPILAPMVGAGLIAVADWQGSAGSLLGAGLALAGHKVLLVDTDGNGSALWRSPGHGQSIAVGIRVVRRHVEDGPVDRSVGIRVRVEASHNTLAPVRVPARLRCDHRG